jgi:hypothetical protein
MSQLFRLVHLFFSPHRDSRAPTPRTRRSRPHVVGDALADGFRRPPARRGDDVSRAARGPAARGRKTDEKGMRRPRGDQAPRGVRSRRARLARARARDRDARRRSDDLETGAGGVAQRAPPGPAPERARLFVLPGDAWRNALRLPFFAPPPTARHPRISANCAKFSNSTRNAFSDRHASFFSRFNTRGRPNSPCSRRAARARRCRAAARTRGARASAAAGRPARPPTGAATGLPRAPRAGASTRTPASSAGPAAGACSLQPRRLPRATSVPQTRVSPRRRRGRTRDALTKRRASPKRRAC